MSTKDLINISTRPDFKEITAKGGRVKSPAKTFANQINAIKRMNPENVEKRCLKMVRDPEYSALQITRLITELLKTELSDKMKSELIGKMTQAHTAIHGQKTKNTNVNIDLTSNKIIERLKNWKKEQVVVLDNEK